MRIITEDALKERLKNTDYHRSVECWLLRELLKECVELESLPEVQKLQSNISGLEAAANSLYADNMALLDKA